MRGPPTAPTQPQQIYYAALPPCAAVVCALTTLRAVRRPKGMYDSEYHASAAYLRPSDVTTWEETTLAPPAPAGFR